VSQLIDQGVPAPLLQPTVTGGVTVEWHSGVGELAVEFLPEGEEAIAYFFDARSGDEWEQPLMEAVALVTRVLGRLTETT
jgi:hypothetical protein